MATQVFNVAKGRIAYYASLPAANDGLGVLLLKAAGLEGDDVLNNYDDIAALLAAANDECDFTNYARKVPTGISVTIDDTNNRVDIDFDDLVYTNAGGGTNNSVAKLIVYYDPDTTTGTDSTLIPLSHHDMVFTTDGTTQTITVTGALRAE